MANTIDPASAATATAAAQPAKSSGPGSLDKDAFLKLLVAQMKFQNPMSPTDPSQFMAQSAQFTMIEKLENMEKASADQLKSQQTTEAAALLGQQVVARGADGKDITGIVTGMRITSNGPQLKVNNIEVALDEIEEVDRPTSAA